MKKLAVLLIFTILLVGCGNKASAIAAPVPSAEHTPSPIVEVVETAPEEHFDLCPAVNVGGVVYFDTGLENESITCGTADGKISLQCESWELPDRHDMSNFGTGYEYQFGPQKSCVSVKLENGWYIFATEAQKEFMLHPEEVSWLRGLVVEVTEDAMLVQCYPEDEDCDCLAPLITLPIEGIKPVPFEDCVVEVAYDGIMTEGIPAELGKVYAVNVFYTKSCIELPEEPQPQ